MSDLRPDGWLFDTLSRMEATEMRHANEMRALWVDMMRKLEAHERETHAVEKRVLVIETQRESEGNDLLRMSALMAGVISALFAAGAEGVKRLFR